MKPSLALLCLAAASAQASGPLRFEPAGPQHMPPATVCQQPIPAARAEAATPDSAAVQALADSPQFASMQPLFDAARPQVMWWIRHAGAINLQSVLTAFHEANHMLDFALSDCHKGKAVYFFRGRTYVTDYQRGEAPAFSIAASEIPARFKTALGRYAVYFGDPGVYRGDFFPLIDELNAHVGGAEFELAAAATPLYRELAGQVNAIDGNIGGMADFMLYTVSYLKALRKSDPEAYRLLASRRTALEHVQRLWSAAEAVLEKAVHLAPERGGIYRYPAEALKAVYSPDMLGELDAIGIRHAQRAPGLTASE
ncbi:hypothetical protein [Massilia endophytica]|uniref:hypothetical protein n=1 Tax=Massilia endophytica TaxID=2899220 RepID=UPI001E441816|nr:hypothetical protein [Massilia endophytica]UGQ47798.1 hypothetical protein LSQ66_04815 [Massilia endophytica]